MSLKRQENTKAGLWNKSYIPKYCLSLTGNCYLLGPTCKVNFGGVYHVNNHPHMKVLMFLMRFSRSFTPTQRSFRAFFKFIYIFAFQTDIFGALKGVRYTPELSWQYFIKDSLHLTRFFFEMGGSGPPVHTRMDSQHKVEHPKVSRNRASVAIWIKEMQKMRFITMFPLCSWTSWNVLYEILHCLVWYGHDSALKSTWITGAFDLNQHIVGGKFDMYSATKRWLYIDNL